MDLIADFAAPLALSAIADLIGIPQQDHAQFQQWCHALSQLTEYGPGPQQIAQAHASLYCVRGYFRDLLARRRRESKDDLLSRFQRLEVRGERLNEREIIAMSALLLLAGHDTITHLLANGVLALLQNPAQCKVIQEDPSTIGPAVQELLRYDSPLQGLLRIATHGIEFGGKRVEQGQKVLLWLGAANRDPEQFDEPDRLDVARKMNRHVAFGFGIHRCVGAPLGLLTVATAIRALLMRAPRLRLATKVIEWEGNLLFRNQRSLRVLLN
jgi:cytochrome P450